MSQTCRKCGKIWCDHTEHRAQQCEEYADPQKSFDMNIRACMHSGGFQHDERVPAPRLKLRELEHARAKRTTPTTVVYLA